VSRTWLETGLARLVRLTLRCYSECYTGPKGSITVYSVHSIAWRCVRSVCAWRCVRWNTSMCLLGCVSVCAWLCVCVLAGAVPSEPLTIPCRFYLHDVTWSDVRWHRKHKGTYCMVVKSAVVASQRRSVSSYRGYPPSELPARTSATGVSTQHLPEGVPFFRLCTFFSPHCLRYFSDACVSLFDRLLWRSRPLGCLSEALYCDNVSVASCHHLIGVAPRSAMQGKKACV